MPSRRRSGRIEPQFDTPLRPRATHSKGSLSMRLNAVRILLVFVIALLLATAFAGWKWKSPQQPDAGWTWDGASSAYIYVS
jgi:hypothetical protein